MGGFELFGLGCEEFDAVVRAERSDFVIVAKRFDHPKSIGADGTRRAQYRNSLTHRPRSIAEKPDMSRYLSVVLAKCFISCQEDYEDCVANGGWFWHIGDIVDPRKTDRGSDAAKTHAPFFAL